MTVINMKPRLHACGICGRERRADQMIYSRHTGKRYCKRHLLKVKS